MYLKIDANDYFLIE